MASSLYKAYETNRNLEQEGVPVLYGDNSRIWIRRAGGSNKLFLRSAEAFRRKYKRKLELDTLKFEESREEALNIYIQSIVVKWEGVEDRDGNPMECTPENIRKLFTDLPDLFNDLQQDAMTAELFKDAEEEEEAKN